MSCPHLYACACGLVGVYICVKGFEALSFSIYQVFLRTRCSCFSNMKYIIDVLNFSQLRNFHSTVLVFTLVNVLTFSKFLQQVDG